MGRYDCGSIWSFRGFLIGMMVAIFQSAGIYSLHVIILIRNSRGVFQHFIRFAARPGAEFR